MATPSNVTMQAASFAAALALCNTAHKCMLVSPTPTTLWDHLDHETGVLMTGDNARNRDSCLQNPTYAAKAAEVERIQKLLAALERTFPTATQEGDGRKALIDAKKYLKQHLRRSKVDLAILAGHILTGAVVALHQPYTYFGSAWRLKPDSDPVQDVSDDEKAAWKHIYQ